MFQATPPPDLCPHQAGMEEIGILGFRERKTSTTRPMFEKNFNEKNDPGNLFGPKSKAGIFKIKGKFVEKIERIQLQTEKDPY